MDKPFAITLDVGSSLANKTGSWRTERPVYIDSLPPCNNACPAGENIQQWLYQAEDGGYQAAWRQIMADNPLPAVMGRACYRPCETACNRAQLDTAVGINSVERFLGDEAIKEGWTVLVTAQPTGKRVLIVGAGPAGMSAAYHLTLAGHQVTVADSSPQPGGMMRYGIPAYRLPREVIDAELGRILDRRTRQRMPAHDIEVEEATAEGVRLMWLSTISRAEESKLVIEKMQLNDKGFPEPTGEFEELAADSVVLALGQESDLGLLDGVPGVEFTDGVVRVGADLMTGYPGIFAGGDMVPADRTVTVAVGHGKKAARNIDAWLRGTDDRRPPRHGLAEYDKLNTWYYSDAPATVRPQLDAARRVTTFDEITGGLDASTALYEARRCLSCGNCFECDNCYGSCPDNAVIKLEPGQKYEFDYDYCKGCGICVAECPSGSIIMVPEQI
jgi:2-oxoacid:acceptor oxidoreductase delta subunit (pyruvate/2-ketoisovalerate family)